MEANHSRRTDAVSRQVLNPAFRVQSLRDALPRAPAPQFPVIFRRAADVADRHVDGDDRATVAGLPADGISGAAGRFRFREPDSDIAAGVFWWIHRRPVKPALGGEMVAEDGLDCGVFAGGDG